MFRFKPNKLWLILQVAFFPRTVYTPHVSQRSSDDEDHGGRSPPLEVSDEECLRDRAPYVPQGELGKEPNSQAMSCCTYIWRVRVLQFSTERLTQITWDTPSVLSMWRFSVIGVMIYVQALSHWTCFRCLRFKHLKQVQWLSISNHAIHVNMWLCYMTTLHVWSLWLLDALHQEGDVCSCSGI